MNAKFNFSMLWKLQVEYNYSRPINNVTTSYILTLLLVVKCKPRFYKIKFMYLLY